MEHLVRLHDAGVYRIESGNAVEITEPCEECGKRDDICLSWEEGKREEVLGRFLTGKDKKIPDVEKAFKEGQTKDELVLGTRIYFTITKDIISSLYLVGSITKNEELELLKQNRINEKNQLKQIKKESNKLFFKKILSI